MNSIRLLLWLFHYPENRDVTVTTLWVISGLIISADAKRFSILESYFGCWNISQGERVLGRNWEGQIIVRWRVKSASFNLWERIIPLSSRIFGRKSLVFRFSLRVIVNNESNEGIPAFSPIFPCKNFRQNQYLSRSDKCHWVLEHFLPSHGFRQSFGVDGDGKFRPTRAARLFTHPRPGKTTPR